MSCRDKHAPLPICEPVARGAVRRAASFGEAWKSWPTTQTLRRIHRERVPGQAGDLARRATAVAGF